MTTSRIPFLRLFLTAALLLAGCSSTSDSNGNDVRTDVREDARADAPEDLSADAIRGDGGPGDAAPRPVEFTVMTFNVGTTAQALHDKDEEAGEGDGYTSEHAAWISEHYGNNLSWKPAEAALRQFIAERRPDIIGFQEMFYDPWCADEPDPPDELEMVCEGYDPAGPLTVERLVGPDYQVASAQGHPDNWIAVRREFGTLVGCPDEGPCAEGSKGFGIPDCCSGARVSSIDVQLADGRLLTVVDVHTNGLPGPRGRDSGRVRDGQRHHGRHEHRLLPLRRCRPQRGPLERLRRAGQGLPLRQLRQCGRTADPRYGHAPRSRGQRRAGRLLRRGRVE